MEAAYNETQRSLDVCLNRPGSKLEARAAKTALGGLQSFDVRTGTANLRQKLSLGQTLETIHI
jgi:hypothetical protein